MPMAWLEDKHVRPCLVRTELELDAQLGDSWCCTRVGDSLQEGFFIFLLIYSTLVHIREVS